MRVKFNFKMKYLTQLVLSGALISAAHVSFGQEAVDLGTVQSNAGTDTSSQSQDSAAYQAPTKGSLTSTDPQSVISQRYIQETAKPGASYADIVSIAPSVFSVAPNGPGLMANQGLSMRGFQDGQFNVTFDGIPWGESNDNTHHTQAYFMSQDMGQTVVESGPGTASNVGNATFGGTIAVTSKDPRADAAFSPFASAGSFNTQLAGAEFDTGVMKNYGDATAYIDYKSLTSNGYLSNANQARQNLFTKFVKPLSDNTVMTVVAMKNDVNQNTPQGATLQQIAQYGRNYGLNTDPNSMSSAAYNQSQITSDFEYVGLKTQQDEWAIDNKVYSTGLYHNSYNGTDLTGTTTNVANGGQAVGAVPGVFGLSDSRTFGDVLKSTRPLGSGTLGLGGWFARQSSNNSQYNVNFSSGLNNLASLQPGGNYQMTDVATTLQPYAEYVWDVTDAFSVTPGLKYTSLTRTVDEIVPRGGAATGSTSATFTALLPSLSGHYYIQKNWSAYLQYAQGYQAPNLNLFFNQNPLLNQVQAQKTTNYQLGTTWESQRLTLSGDVYAIKFNNQIQSQQIGANTDYFNAGGASYSGVEGTATYVVGAGYSLYGNFSVNNASATSGIQVQNTPSNTAAAGLIYNQGPAYLSLMAKEIGKRYSGYSSFDANGNPINPIAFSSFTTVDFSSSYSLGKNSVLGKNAKIGLQVSNLLNKNALLTSPGQAPNAAGTPFFFVLPTRSVMLNLSLDL
jgi:iron complex outermembrane receptor protein